MKKAIFTNAPSPIHGHHTTTGHLTNMDNFSIIGREGHGFARTIKVFISRMVNNPILNKTISQMLISTECGNFMYESL